MDGAEVDSIEEHRIDWSGRNYQIAAVHRKSLVTELLEGVTINVPFAELQGSFSPALPGISLSRPYFGSEAPYCRTIRGCSSGDGHLQQHRRAPMPSAAAEVIDVASVGDVNHDHELLSSSNRYRTRYGPRHVDQSP
jgi:hypothetical protein